ncbi:hypothetical protein L484_024660 [Morus notabilis]|uniref:Uncharacterized protein n=1 Tax=Morus notabilis TaxID=981085 RepID=W9RF89_9ROSA|nr:hypothetical protein L484_024660 [Morus notabilis]
MTKEVGEVKAEMIQSLADFRRIWEEYVKKTSETVPAPEKVKTVAVDGEEATSNAGAAVENRPEVAMGTSGAIRVGDRRGPRELGREIAREENPRYSGDREVPMGNRRGESYGYRGDWWGAIGEEGIRRNGGGLGGWNCARGNGGEAWRGGTREEPRRDVPRAGFLHGEGGNRDVRRNVGIREDDIEDEEWVANRRRLGV